MDTDEYEEAYNRAARRHRFSERLAATPPSKQYNPTDNVALGGYNILIIVMMSAAVVWVGLEVLWRVQAYYREKEIVADHERMMQRQVDHAWMFANARVQLARMPTLEEENRRMNAKDGIFLIIGRILRGSIILVSRSLYRTIREGISNSTAYAKVIAFREWLREAPSRWWRDIYYSDAAHRVNWYCENVWNWLRRQFWTFVFGFLLLFLVSHWIDVQQRAAESSVRTVPWGEARYYFQVPEWILEPRRSSGSNSHYRPEDWPPVEVDSFEVDEKAKPGFFSGFGWFSKGTKDPQVPPSQPEMSSAASPEAVASKKHSKGRTAVDEPTVIWGRDAAASPPSQEDEKETAKAPSVGSKFFVGKRPSEPNLTQQSELPFEDPKTSTDEAGQSNASGARRRAWKNVGEQTLAWCAQCQQWHCCEIPY